MATPHEIASWVVTPLITGVIGWVLANIKNSQESKAKKTERDMALRKEVFLNAAESLVKMVRYLANFSNITICNEDRTKHYESSLGAIGKMHLIASNDTLSALIKANEYLLVSDQLLWASLQKVSILKELFEIEQKQSPNSQQTTDARRAYLSAHCDLVKEAMSSAITFGSFLTDVVICARDELDLPLDVQRYRAEIERSYAATRQSLDDLMTQYKSIAKIP